MISRKTPPRNISPKRLRDEFGGKVPFSSISSDRKPVKKVGKGKTKREARNREYYAGAEWRAKRKAVFERDGYQCVEWIWVSIVDFYAMSEVPPRAHFARGGVQFRCPNRGEIVNGKQTARGLVAEEKGYQHRGIEGLIDRIVTRCKDCDRRCTPLERANHAHGLRNQRG